MRGEDQKRSVVHGSISGTLRNLNAGKLGKRPNFLYLHIMRADNIRWASKISVTRIAGEPRDIQIANG